VKYEPAINHALLLQTVRRAYGLSVSDLLFVPVGAPSLCYALRCEGETPYFLKVWPDVRASRANTLRDGSDAPIVGPHPTELGPQGLAHSVGSGIIGQDREHLIEGGCRLEVGEGLDQPRTSGVPVDHLQPPPNLLLIRYNRDDDICLRYSTPPGDHTRVPTLQGGDGVRVEHVEHL